MKEAAPEIFQDTPSSRPTLIGSAAAPKIILKGRQARFFRDRTRFPGLFGSIASGKTTLGCLKGILYSLIYPNNYGIVLRNTYKELQTSTAKKFFELIDTYYAQFKPPGGGRNLQDMTQKFINGSEVQFLHSGSEDLFQGPEVGWFLVDQAESIPERIAEKLTERLRRPGFPQQGMYVGNTNRGKNWCWRWFVRRERPYSAYHPITILDNIENLDPPYIADLMRRPDSWKKVWLFGSWDAPGGQIFAFQTEHFFDYFSPPKEWNRITIIDPADGMGPCGSLAGAVDFQGNYWVFKEYMGKEKHVREHAHVIKGLWGNARFTFMDPSAWRRQSVPSDTGKDEWITLADRYMAQGIYASPAENAILPSIDMVHEYMEIDQDAIHPITKRQGAPRLFISRSCTKLMEQNTEWTWETLDDAENVHLVDCLRYFVASRPPAPERWREYERPRQDDYPRRRGKQDMAWMAQ